MGIWSDTFNRTILKRQLLGCMCLQCTPLTPTLMVVTKIDVGMKNTQQIFHSRVGFEPRPPELRARDESITPPSSHKLGLGFLPTRDMV